MSEIAATSSLIAMGVFGACVLGAWLWVGIDECRKRRAAWRECWREWMQVLKK